MAFTAPQFSTLHETEELVEVLNNQFKVNSIESGHSNYHQLEIDGGRKYIKVWVYLIGSDGKRTNGRSIYMFIDKETGAVYKPASIKAPAKGIRFYLDKLVANPGICDQYGSFLYARWIIMTQQTDLELRTTASLRLLAQGFKNDFAKRVYEDEKFTDLLMELSADYVTENIPIIDEMHQYELALMLLESIKLSTFD